MNTRTLTILAVVTLLLLVAAIVVAGRRGGGGATEVAAGGVVLPDLEARANDVSRLRIEQAGDELRLERRDGTWVLPDKGGYPAQFERVKETVLALARMRIIEAKTSNPERWAAIGVEAPDAEGAGSILVELGDDAGDTLAALVVGDAVTSGREPRWYVRRLGESQAYLAEGRLDLATDPLRWTDRAILQLARERVKHVKIVHADGEVVEVERDEPTETNFIVIGVPEGRELRFQGAGNTLGMALSFLQLDDVRPAHELDFTADDVTTAEFNTFDGLTIIVRTLPADDSGRTWATVSALAAETPADDDETAADAEETPDVEAEAQALEERLQGWAFALSSGQGANMRKRMDEMLKPLESADDAEPAKREAGWVFPDVPEEPAAPATDEPSTTDEPAADEPATNEPGGR